MDATMFFMFFSRQLNFFASRNILLDLLDDEAYDTEVNSCNQNQFAFEKTTWTLDLPCVHNWDH